SSALWPFATLGWPEETPELGVFYPNDVSSTDRSIIFLWEARMIMAGLELMGEPPFHTVNIHSTVNAPDGRRMSKSLGTGFDPLELSAASVALYHLTFDDFCDWYAEAVKPRLRDGDEDARATALAALQRLLALLHPVMPHVTEEIWSNLRGAAARLIVSPWP